MREDRINILYKDAVDKVSTTKHKLKQKEYLQKGKYPVVDQGQSIVGGYTDDKEKLLDCKLPVIVFGDHTKKVKLINFKFAPGADGTKVLEPKKGILPKYISLLTEILVFKIKDKGYARHYQHIEKEYLPLAPLPIQRAIVTKIENLFTSLDKGIADLNKAQEQLKVYRQAVLKKAFEKGYDKQKLGKIANVSRGKSKHRPRNDKSLFGGKYPFIQTGEIREANGGIIKNYSTTYSEKGLAQSKLWPKGTLCLTIAANIGETAFLGFASCFPDSVVGIKPNKEILSDKYLNYYIQKIKKDIDNKASATAQKNINVRFLDALEIPMPSLETQKDIIQEIESRLSVCDKVEQSITEGLEKSEALRQSILKKAFEGKLLSEAEIEKCKQEADYEPASVLLEQIKKEKKK